MTAQGPRHHGVPDVVVRAVESVSWADENETCEELIERAAADPLGRLVKLADNALNLESNALLAEEDLGLATRLRAKNESARERLLAQDI
ncbi:hypothetical protein [Tessaracoccus sp. MC1756]|uniref:hypothetical protein n=1 Tax=Tessaracoccus sp. MC1756 TaxID=2760311 RepID=UPI001C71E964|nr:hypothetical protein [Tessaracoccus sp. MC1756]